eukprot:gene25657-33504_t
MGSATRLRSVSYPSRQYDGGVIRQIPQSRRRDAFGRSSRIPLTIRVHVGAGYWFQSILSAMLYFLNDVVIWQALLKAIPASYPDTVEMNLVSVVIPSQLRHLIRGHTAISIEAETVGEALRTFADHSDLIKEALFDADGKLHRFARLFVDGRPSTFEDGDDERLQNGAVVTLIIALVGG